MFQTFTGTSRRPRNINLSGQRADPFAAGSWSPATSAVSQTISNAAADRAHRQQERLRTQSAKHIQRVWRGHTTRQTLANARKLELEALYTRKPSLHPRERIPLALPLLLFSFSPRDVGSRAHLNAFLQDLVQTGTAPLQDAQIHDYRLTGLLKILVSEILQRGVSSMGCSSVLGVLAMLVDYRPSIVFRISNEYYSLLARLGKEAKLVDSFPDLLVTAITRPICRGIHVASRTARSFVFSFLTAPDLLILERDPSSISQKIGLEPLSTEIISELRSGPSTHGPSVDDLLWLLAHVIALRRSTSWDTKGSQYLETVYAILQALTRESQQILANVPRNEASVDDENPSQRPPYVESQIKSLVDTRGISDLLHKMTTDYTESFEKRKWDDASLLAGFTLTLLRAFPNSGDEIRMRLFCADATLEGGEIATTKFFFMAVKRTCVYQEIKSGRKSALDLLRAEKGEKLRSSRQHEWKTVLLFLELYVFSLRLSDDSDFFGGMNEKIGQEYHNSSRVRKSSLGFQDILGLSVFLKNLAFSLYYDAGKILQTQERSKVSSPFLNSYLETGVTGPTSADASAQDADLSPLAALLGVEFNAFRETVITALRMLYERDSRRPFLSPGHWLMTCRFDMSAFIEAVVIEKQRQQNLQTQEADEAQQDSANWTSDDTDGGWAASSASYWHGSRLSRHARIEMLREKQRRANRERTLAAIGPKLEILRNMPFVIPFETRVQIFRKFVVLDKMRRFEGRQGAQDDWVMGFAEPHPGARHQAKIRRGHLFDDAYDQFYQLGEGLKDSISIIFIDKFGNTEAGIDGGGVTKEFLTSITTEAFSMSHENRLFVSNAQNLLYPNASAVDEQRQMLAAGDDRHQAAVEDILRRFEFLGRIVGKCMYDGVLIDVAFAGFFLLKWASSGQGENSYRANVNDLKELDEELYNGLMRLKDYPGDIAELEQDFTIVDPISIPGESLRTLTRKLIPNGDKVIVNNENRPLYISYVARHRLVVQPYQQTKAFLRGLGSIINPSWIAMFNQNELQRLVGGDSSQIDIDDLRENTEYSGVYQIGDDGEEHPTIQLFWEVMREMSDGERRDVVKYVTSTPRAPLLGFSQLHPPFTIRDSSQDQDRLPSTSTCVNLLKLPQYRTKERLRDRLRYAIQSGAGFDLS